MSTSPIIQLLTYYEAMLAFAHEMLGAARIGDWEGLVDAEAKRGAVEQILTHSDTESWKGDNARTKAVILQAILATDTETKALVGQRMASLQGMIGSVGTEKKLNNAYNLG